MARTRQPQGAITVNRGNQLAEGLTHLYTSGLPVDFAKNALLSGPRLDPLPGFLGMYGGNASATKYQLLDDSLSTTGDLTVGALFFANETTAAQGVFNRTQESGSYPQNWNLYVYNGQIRFQGSQDDYAAVAADIVAGTPYLVVGRHINSSREWSIWLNGIKVQYRTAVGVLNTAGTQTTQIGAGNGGAIPLNGGVYLAVGYKRALDDSEIVSLSNNPWQIFAPQRRLWIQLGAAAGGGAVDATANGATVVAAASAIAGSAAAASAATAATVSATSSAIAGSATAASQNAAATVVATASVIAGSKTAASASPAATVAATASTIPGSASGTASGTATGATVVANAEIIAGSATGNAAGTAVGATVAADASAIAGALSASAAATGQTATVTASATAGSAQSDHAAAGAVVSASATAIPGAIAVGAGATTPGATVAATVTYQSGAVAAASSAAGWTQVVTAIAARGVAYGALPDIDPRYLVPSRKRRFTVQARGRRFNART